MVRARSYGSSKATWMVGWVRFWPEHSLGMIGRQSFTNLVQENHVRLDLCKHSFLAVKKNLQVSYSTYIASEVIEKLSKVPHQHPPGSFQGKQDMWRAHAKKAGSTPGLGFHIVKPQTLYSDKHKTSAPGLGFIIVKPQTLYSARHITSAPGLGFIIVKPQTLYSARHITSTPGLGFIIARPQTLYSARHITSAPGLGFIIVKPQTLYSARHITSAPGLDFIITMPQTLYSARHITSSPGLGFIIVKPQTLYSAKHITSTFAGFHQEGKGGSVGGINPLTHALWGDIPPLIFTNTVQCSHE